MDRKKIAIVMVVLMVMSSFTIVLATNNIIPDNNFVGEGIELTLEEATEKMLKDSFGVKTAELNEAAVKATIKDYDYTLSKMKSGYQKTLLTMRMEFAEQQQKPNYEAELNALKLEVRNKYFATLLADEMVKIQEESLALNEELLEQTKKKYELGLVSKNNLSDAELTVVKAKNALESTVNNAKLAKMDLNSYLGYDIMQELILTDTLEPLEMSEVALADAIALALENNNSIKGVEFNRDIQGVNLTSLGVRYPKTSATYLNAEVTKLKAEESYESVVDMIEMDVRRKYMNMVQGLKDIEVSKDSVENAQKQVDSAKLSYELGQATFLTVQQAQLGLQTEQIALQQAIHDYNLAVDQYNMVMTPGTSTVAIQ